MKKISQAGSYVALACMGIATIALFVGFFVAALPLCIVAIVLDAITIFCILPTMIQISNNRNDYKTEFGPLSPAPYAIAIGIFIVAFFLLFLAFFVAALPLCIVTMILFIGGLVSIGFGMSRLGELIPINKEKSDTKHNSKKPSRYCEECGAKLSPTAKYCPKCGTKVK